jgi:uncharacterized protein YndB with AHSA1/START domain
MADAEAEVRRFLRAPPDRVFAAFADPAQVRQWLRPSADIRLDVLELDFREGGAWRFAYHVPDGPVVVIGGRYQVIEPPSRLVYSWIIEPPDEHAGLESEVTVTIAAAAGGADLHIRHARLILPGSLQRHAEGWLGALDLLGELLTSGKESR